MSQTVAYVLGIVVLVIGIGLSVALHELGHMIPAKRFGVKVPEYFIGFGPRLEVEIGRASCRERV